MQELCVECGAPAYITAEHLWLDNGDIVFKRAPWRRLAFVETENLDPLLSGVEKLIGVSIEHIVMATYRKAVRLYLQHLLPGDMPQQVSEGRVDLKEVDDLLCDVGRVVGVGDFRFVEMRYEGDEDDYFTNSITEPYSVPLCASLHAAALGAILGYDHRVVYQEVRPGLYNVTAYPDRQPEEFEQRLFMQPYEHVRGDIDLEKCAGCGGPAALADYRWHPQRGVIFDRRDNRRMALQGHNQLYPVFQELERELGPDIPQVMVEAQRNYARSSPLSIYDIDDRDRFRSQLAFRGLGSLQELTVGARGLHMRLENATMHPLIVGTLQGIFDKTYGVDSAVEWSLSPQRSLEVEIRPPATSLFPLTSGGA